MFGKIIPVEYRSIWLSESDLVKANETVRPPTLERYQTIIQHTEIHTVSLLHLPLKMYTSFFCRDSQLARGARECRGGDRGTHRRTRGREWSSTSVASISQTTHDGRRKKERSVRLVTSENIAAETTSERASERMHRADSKRNSNARNASARDGAVKKGGRLHRRKSWSKIRSRIGKREAKASKQADRRRR